MILKIRVNLFTTPSSEAMATLQDIIKEFEAKLQETQRPHPEVRVTVTREVKFI